MSLSLVLSLIPAHISLVILSTTKYNLSFSSSLLTKQQQPLAAERQDGWWEQVTENWDNLDNRDKPISLRD